mmetsp:Transcript_7844/g.29350  ORF Transcript_7844/g.29350 Transcript_7844/m.29350 type:complete len:647 (-) Transcript_7844:25-1965(-)
MTLNTDIAPQHEEFKTTSQPAKDPLPLKKQSVDVGEHTFRRPGSETALLSTIDSNVTTMAESWAKSAKNHADKQCLGKRELKDGKLSDEYTWLSYKEVDKQIENLCSGILNANFDAGQYGIWAGNRVEWVVTSMALARMKGYVSVAVYEKMREEETQYIMEHSEMKAVFCSGTSFDDALQNTLKVKNVKTIVCFDELTQEQQQASQKDEYKDVRIMSYQDLLDNGKEKARTDYESPQASDLLTLNYTSGTSGLPKAVIISNKNIIAAAAGIRDSLRHNEGEQQVFMSYLPLAHILERVAEQVMFDYGFALGFWSGEIDGLKDDIAHLAPTIIPSVPRVCEIIEELIHKNVHESNPVAKLIFSSAVATTKGPNSNRGKFWDAVVFKKVRQKLGGRLQGMLSGGAPLPEQTQGFLHKALNIPIVQGYGLTETCGAGTMQNEDDETHNCIGAPLACNEIRLVSCPDLGYSVDKDPVCGEIWLRGPNITGGYFKDEEKTKEAFTDDGWFKTGDIAKRNPNGSFSVIDRKKNLVKLAQGEYVPIEHLESLFQESELVERIWVYGDGAHRNLVAVIQPNGTKDKDKVLQSLDNIASKKNLHGYERIKAVHFVDKDFAEIDTSLETASHKLRRKQMQEYFQKQIDEMYNQIGK